jgi:hypothetical protein
LWKRRIYDFKINQKNASLNRRTEVEFLGTIISENYHTNGPIYINSLAGIRDWPSPTTVKQTAIILRILRGIITEDSFPDSQKSHDHFTN